MKILIVDDDRVLADIVAYTFRREGFEVIQVFDGQAALERWKIDNPDLIVLDVNLPGMDGFSILRHIRETSNVPVLMLTVRGDDDDVVHGLEQGADDYVPKPFSPRQLVARAHAVLRRAAQLSETPVGPVSVVPTSDLFACGLTLAANRRELMVGKDRLALTELEGRLLELLMQNAGQVVPVEMIFQHVWGDKSGSSDDLRQLVRRLRSKLEFAKPAYVKNIPGLGYGLMAENGNPE